MPGYSGDFEKYIEVTVSNTYVPLDISDFPTPIDLGNITDANFWANVASDGKDLRITNSDGSTEYPIDMCYIDTAGEKGLIIAKLTHDTDANQTFRIYYKNASATAYAEGDTYGRHNVYRSEFAAYWWLGTDPTSGVIDRTSNNCDLTHTNMESGDLQTSLACCGERGIDFDGSNERLSVTGANSTSLNIYDTGIWFAAYAYMDAQTTADMHPVQRDFNAPSYNTGFGLDWETNSSRQIVQWDAYLINSTEVIDPTEWGYSAGWIVPTSTAYLGINGATVVSSTAANLINMQANSTSPATWIGGHPSLSRYFDGKIVMVNVAKPTISSGVFDDNWRILEYNLWHQQSSAISFGTEQSNPNTGGGATIAASRRIVNAS